MSWLAILLLVGASQGALLSVVILSMKTGDRVANCFLAALVALVSARLLLNFFVYADIALYSPLYSLHLVALLVGPALYLYVRALTEPGFQLTTRLALHLLILVPGLVFVGAKSGQWTEHIAMPGLVALQDPDIIWVQLASAVLLCGYGYMSLKKLSEHRGLIEQTFSVIEEISLSWLRWLILSFIAVKVLHLVLVLLTYWGLIAFETRTWLFMLSSLSVLYLVSLGGLRQPLIFTQSLRNILQQIEDAAKSEEATAVFAETGDGTHSSADQKEPEPLLPREYKKTGLDADRITLLWSRLIQVMEEKKPYIDSGLSLPVLAKIAAVKPHDLSRVINTQASVSFYEFVNGYRVEAAKKHLLTENTVKRTMLNIAMDVGFNSQSTFYNHFKKHTGMTPKQYKNRQAKAVV